MRMQVTASGRRRRGAVVSLAWQVGQMREVGVTSFPQAPQMAMRCFLGSARAAMPMRRTARIRPMNCPLAMERKLMPRPRMAKR